MLAMICQGSSRPILSTVWASTVSFGIMLGVADLALAQSSAQSNASKLNTLRQRDGELEAARAEQKRAAEAEARLKRELETIGDDRKKLNQALIDTATRLRGLEGRIVGTEIRLSLLAADERKIREKLDSRRAVMAEVLATMQRIGRHPPPAVIVSAEDALQTVRTAIMLGAVMPDMRGQADRLAAELASLVRVRASIGEEQGRLKADMTALADERQRTARLIEERQKQQAETEKELATERQRAADMAREVDNLKDLIARLEKGLDRVTRAARALRESRPEMAALRDPGRLAPAVAFAALRGHLLLPVNGARIREFGANDSVGGTEKGVSIGAAPEAQVTSPCDGWVVYAAPFRNYGQVLILDAGGGYHVVLAGMERISVGVGQFVLTGEPVAVMGNSSQQTAAGGSNQPVLYVEFRKDGTPIDPSPWWAPSEGEKVRG